jgi:hypothetical protein
MYFSENVEVLDAYGCEVIDVKEAPVIDFLGCNAPMGEAISLIVKKFIEVAETLRIALFSVEGQYVSIYERPNPLTFLTQIPKPLFFDFLFPLPLHPFFTLLFNAGWKMA